MNSRKLHDGRQDGLRPLESLSLENVDSFSDLLQAMSKTAFGGRQLGEAFEI
ncbi:MAG: deoxyhypusine synthase, partial [Planctomycetales bacterium]|nr:deoxyhypusine synthase [Planctomycetales bacterium]